MREGLPRKPFDHEDLEEDSGMESLPAEQEEQDAGEESVPDIANEVTPGEWRDRLRELIGGTGA